jgi:methylthioribose-1-phosphate isomerase
MTPREKPVRPPVKVVQWVGSARKGLLRLLDQTELPQRKAFLDCRDVRLLWDAIARLVVRGAPAIGVAAGYGMVLAAQKALAAPDFLRTLADQGDYLKSSRPTAVNLAWAVNRMLDLARAVAGETPLPVGEVEPSGGGEGKPLSLRERCRRGDGEGSLALPSPKGRGVKQHPHPELSLRERGVILDALLAEARAIQAEDEALCMAMGRFAEPIIRRCAGVLTHCNAGALATAGIGTATAGIYLVHASGQKLTVYCDETRPLLQGSRLTAWELTQAGIDAVVITDNMAAKVMHEGRVQMVITGADRIAANGDAANKIGTYGVAVLAKHHGIPFYVAAPYSTFDLSLKSGKAIPIEERGSKEITHGFGRRTAPHGVRTYSPAFDVTPAGLITAIITDRGVIQPVNRRNVLKVIGGGMED